jgi:hypothetical protein
MTVRRFQDSDLLSFLQWCLANNCAQLFVFITLNEENSKVWAMWYNKKQWAILLGSHWPVRGPKCVVALSGALDWGKAALLAPLGDCSWTPSFY